MGKIMTPQIRYGLPYKTPAYERNLLSMVAFQEFIPFPLLRDMKIIYYFDGLPSLEESISTY